MLDRADILRSAHAVARHRMTASRSWRSYREALSDALRREWQNAKAAAAQAQVEAEEATAVPLPTDVAERCAALRLEASYAPHTAPGHARFHTLHAQAHELALAAQLMMIPNKGACHVAC